MNIDALTKTKTIFAILLKQYTDAKCDLNYRNAYELFVAVMLAARCNDNLVNITTPTFFEQYPDIETLSQSTVPDILAIIKDITHADTKARYLLLASNEIMQNFEGNIPNTTKSLESITGIGKKSANTILAEAFGIPAIAVDTHVQCVAKRIGLTNSDNTLTTEKTLCSLLPQEEWITFTHLLVRHGKTYCFAQLPKCTDCPILTYCKYKNPTDSEQQLCLF